MYILFYFPTNKNSNSLETLMEEFSKMGHRIFLLGQEAKGAIHNTVETFGVETDVYLPSKSNSLSFYARHIRYLASYCKSKKIDLVYSHTQPANIVAVFAQYLCNARFIICRHHSDYIMMGSNRNAKVFDWIINRLGKEFIAPSQKVRQQLTEVEGVDSQKVRLINYAYRFENYPRPVAKKVQAIRGKYSCQMLLVAVSRFIPCKRYNLLIDVVKKLFTEGLDVQLLILGNGPLERELKEQVKRLNISQRVHFIGFTTEAMNYLAAADVVVHTSDSEASNSVVKEAGTLEKLVIACRDVGDFDDYIENGKSGILIAKENTSDELYQKLKEVKKNKNAFSGYGKELRKSVLQQFSVQNVIYQYSEVL